MKKTKVQEVDTKTFAGKDAMISMKKDPKYMTLSTDAKKDLEDKLKGGGAVELEENPMFTNDVGKDDYMDDEGRMAKSQMYKMSKYAAKLHHMLDDMEQLPAWVQSKITKASDYMSAVYHYLDYEFARRDGNLMENMDKHKKRATLIEGAMKQFFSMFDQNKTDEEIVQDYAQKGIEVPANLVTTARKNWEKSKELELAIDMGEKEFKNSSKKIVNNTDEVTGMENEKKQMATGLFENKKNKKQNK